MLRSDFCHVLFVIGYELTVGQFNILDHTNFLSPHRTPAQSVLMPQFMIINARPKIPRIKIRTQKEKELTLNKRGRIVRHILG